MPLPFILFIVFYTFSKFYKLLLCVSYAAFHHYSTFPNLNLCSQLRSTVFKAISLFISSPSGPDTRQDSLHASDVQILWMSGSAICKKSPCICDRQITCSSNTGLRSSTLWMNWALFLFLSIPIFFFCKTDQMFSNSKQSLIKHQCTRCPYQNIVLQTLQTARFARGSFALMITWQLGPGQNRSCGCDLTKSRNANCWYLSRVLGRLNRVNTKSSGARTSHSWAIHPMPS